MWGRAFPAEGIAEAKPYRERESWLRGEAAAVVGGAGPGKPGPSRRDQQGWAVACHRDLPRTGQHTQPPSWTRCPPQHPQPLPRDTGPDPAKPRPVSQASKWPGAAWCGRLWRGVCLNL